MINTISSETIDRADKSKISEHQRHQNFVIFGLEEKTGENLERSINLMIRNCGESSKVSSCHRTRVGNSGTHRAVKLSLESQDAATSVLTGATKLKKASADLKNLFISPDRSLEERAIR